MKQIPVSLSELYNRRLPLGRVGENQHVQIVFLCNSIFADYPNATTLLIVTAPGGESYTPEIEKDGTNILWTVTDSDLAKEGGGELQLTFTNGQEVIKSYIGKTQIFRSIAENGEIPTPVDIWIARADERVRQAAQEAAEATVEDLAEEKDTAIAEIQAQETATETAIAQAAAAARASIPGEYRQLSDDVSLLKIASNNSPTLKDDDAEDSDLDISDSQGNVLARFANGHIVTKNFDSSKQNVGVCYVAPDGSDSNTGDSESAPFATFQHAIDAGFKRIIAASGEYKNQQIVMNGLHGISIVCNSNTSAETLFESHVRRTRAKIDNSIDVTGLTAYNSIYRTPLVVGEDSSFYKVFVSKTLDPVYSGSSYYGRVTTYNAILWEIGEEIAGCTRLIPKLTLSECETTAGTFFFDGSYLYIHPTGNSLTGKTYKRLNLDTNQYGVDVRNCTDIHIQGIDVAFFPYYDLHFAHCENLMVKDCCCTFTSYGSAFEVEGADATFVSCVAAKAGADGFGIATYGNASFYDCSALYCYDDGISHHDAATGVIDGGQWIGCMKGGVTPSFGSNVSVKNVVCHGNVYGIYITQSGTRVTNAVLTMQNCLAFDNVTQDIRVTGYDVISHGCAYRTKQIDDGASFAEYGNTVIE